MLGFGLDLVAEQAHVARSSHDDECGAEKDVVDLQAVLAG